MFLHFVNFLTMVEEKKNRNIFLDCLNVLRKNFVPNVKPTSCDAPKLWRFSMGGFDPATPYAEASINYHNHTVTYMIFIMFTVLMALKR